MANKNLLREKLIKRRHDLSLEFRQQASEAICNTLYKIPLIHQASVIAVYYATHGEADPFPIVNQLMAKQWLLPIINNEAQLDFALFDPHSKLVANKYNILEPENKQKTLAPQQIDVMLIPLVAFDLKGNRIGRGAGHYDRALSFINNKKMQKPYLIGVAYEFQKVTQITVDQWDIPLNMIVTEKSSYNL